MAASIDDQVHYQVGVACPDLPPCHVIFSSPGVFITSPHPQAIQFARPIMPKSQTGDPHSYQDQLLDFAQPSCLSTVTTTVGTGSFVDTMPERQSNCQVNSMGLGLPPHSYPNYMANGSVNFPPYGQMEQPFTMADNSSTYTSCPNIWTQPPSVCSPPQNNWGPSAVPNGAINTWCPRYENSQNESTTMDQNLNTAQISWAQPSIYASPVTTWPSSIRPDPALPQVDTLNQNVDRNSRDVVSAGLQTSDSYHLEDISEQESISEARPYDPGVKVSFRESGTEDKDMPERPMTPGIETLKSNCKADRVCPKLMLRFEDIQGGSGGAAVSKNTTESHTEDKVIYQSPVTPGIESLKKTNKGDSVSPKMMSHFKDIHRGFCGTAVSTYATESDTEDKDLTESPLTPRIESLKKKYIADRVSPKLMSRFKDIHGGFGGAAVNGNTTESDTEDKDMTASPVTPGIESLKNKYKADSVSPKLMLRFKDIHRGLGGAAVSTYTDEPESPSGHTLLNISNTLLPKSEKVKKNSPAIRAFNFVTPKKLKKKKGNKGIFEAACLDLPPLMSGQVAKKADIDVANSEAKQNVKQPVFHRSRCSENMKSSPVRVSRIIGNAFYSLENDMYEIEDSFCENMAAGKKSKNTGEENGNGMNVPSTKSGHYNGPCQMPKNTALGPHGNGKAKCSPDRSVSNRYPAANALEGPHDDSEKTLSYSTTEVLPPPLNSQGTCKESSYLASAAESGHIPPDVDVAMATAEDNNQPRKDLQSSSDIPVLPVISESITSGDLSCRKKLNVTESADSQEKACTSPESHTVDAASLSGIENTLPNDLSYLLCDGIAEGNASKDFQISLSPVSIRKLSFLGTDEPNGEESPPSRDSNVEDPTLSSRLLEDEDLVNQSTQAGNSLVSPEAGIAEGGEPGPHKEDALKEKDRSEYGNLGDNPMGASSKGKESESQGYRIENSPEDDQISEFVRTLLDSDNVDGFKDIDEVNLDSCIEAHEYMESLMPGCGEQEGTTTPILPADSESESLLNFLNSAPLSKNNHENSLQDYSSIGSPDFTDPAPRQSGSDNPRSNPPEFPAQESELTIDKNIELVSEKVPAGEYQQVTAEPPNPGLVLPEGTLDESINFWSQNLMDTLSSPSVSFSPFMAMQSPPPSSGKNFTSPSIKSLEEFAQSMTMESSAHMNHSLDPSLLNPLHPPPGNKHTGLPVKLPGIETLITQKNIPSASQSRSTDAATLNRTKGKKPNKKVKNPPKKKNNCPIVYGTTGRRGKNQKKVMMFIQPEEMAGMKGEPMVYSVPNMPPIRPSLQNGSVPSAAEGSHATKADQRAPQQPDAAQNNDDGLAAQSHISDNSMTPNRCSQLLDDLLADGEISCQDENIPCAKAWNNGGQAQEGLDALPTAPNEPSPTSTLSLMLPPPDKDSGAGPAQQELSQPVLTMEDVNVPGSANFTSPSCVLGSRSRVRKKTTLPADQSLIEILDACTEDRPSSISVEPEDYQSPAKLRPQHYALKCLIVGNFMHNHPANIPEKHDLFKVYFGKRRLVYTFLVLEKNGKPLRSGRGCCQQCLIEVLFDDIEELYGCKDYLRIKVSKNPMVRIYDSGEPGARPRVNDRPCKKRVYDITQGELFRCKTHELQLGTPCAQFVCDALGFFDPRLKHIVIPPKKDSVRANSMRSESSVELTTPPLSPDSPAQLSSSMESPDSQQMDLFMVDPEEATKAKVAKAKCSKLYCRCRLGCRTQRCRCRRTRRLCEVECRCRCEKQCEMMLTNMKIFNFTRESAELNVCLYDNLQKSKVFDRAVTEQKYMKLPCCRREVPNINLAYSLNCNLCDATFKYSWCTGMLHNVDTAPRNHCIKCRQCFGTHHNHCQDPKVGCPCCEMCPQYVQDRPLWSQLAAIGPQSSREGLDERPGDIIVNDLFPDFLAGGFEVPSSVSLPITFGPLEQKNIKEKTKTLEGACKFGLPNQLVQKSRKRVAEIDPKPTTSKSKKKGMKSKGQGCVKCPCPVLTKHAKKRPIKPKRPEPLLAPKPLPENPRPSTVNTSLVEGPAPKRKRMPKNGKKVQTIPKEKARKKSRKEKLVPAVSCRQSLVDKRGIPESVQLCAPTSLKPNVEPVDVSAAIVKPSHHLDPNPLNTPEYVGSSSFSHTDQDDGLSWTLNPLVSDVEHHSTSQYESFLPPGFLGSPSWETFQPNFSLGLDVSGDIRQDQGPPSYLPAAAAASTADQVPQVALTTIF